MDFFLFGLSIDFVYHLSEAFDCDDEFSLRVNKIPTKLNKGPCSEFNVCFHPFCFITVEIFIGFGGMGKVITLSHPTASVHISMMQMQRISHRNEECFFAAVICPPPTIFIRLQELDCFGSVWFGSEIECKQYAFDIQLRISRARFN